MINVIWRDAKSHKEAATSGSDKLGVSFSASDNIESFPPEQDRTYFAYSGSR